MTVSQPVGEVYDPLGVHANNPYPLYAAARRAEPVFYSPRLGAWVVTRYQDVLQVLKDTDTFSSRNALRPLFAMAPEAAAEFGNGFPHGPSLTDGDGELHHRLRGTVALQQLIAECTKQRRGRPGTDLISQTTATLAPGDGPLAWQPLAELVAALFTVVMAGHVTTGDAGVLSPAANSSQRAARSTRRMGVRAVGGH